jgi:putative AbiEii toxin of type IV toxin-antitoxin system/AAA domain-containing protein
MADVDAGAHFRKCDFQVHTPRDLNWQGQRPVTDDERREYAREFVAACRAKELGAVAITDHHDLAFFRYIREAANAETDGAGKPLPENEKLVVFPGMELTLAVPCQALLILDAEFPVDLLPQVVQALSIIPTPDDADRHAEIKRLEHIKTLEELYDELNKREFLQGRFTVFPHVGESGSFTLLRSGFAAKYKNMPCVGGFVDGSVTQHGKGNSDILNGKNKDYGNKAIAVFQTSDSRSRDFAALGTHVTWVKWALPTAEALRQACLARHSRISHVEPRLPTVRISRVEVTNSKFMGPIVLDFNPQYNAIIGGRGTGKSTILEYVRWALCDQPPAIVDGGTEVADFQKRRQALIENTLLPLSAAIDVCFLVDDVPHAVRRKAAGELLLKIGAAPFQPCSEDNVRDLLSVRAYSQKQLSAVGARLEELRRFVTAPVRSDLVALEEKIGALRTELRVTFDRLERFRALGAELTAHELERKSLIERISSLRASIKGLSAEDTAILSLQAVYDAEERIVGALERDGQSAKAALVASVAELSRIAGSVDLGPATENPEIITAIHDALGVWAKNAAAQMNVLRDAFDEPVASKPLGPFFEGIRKWRVRQENHHKQYEEARKRAATHDETLGQIAALEARLKEINKDTDAKTEQLARLGTPDAEFADLRNRWAQYFEKRADILAAQCAKLSATPSTRLRATLRRAADVPPVAERLKQICRGTRIRTEKIDTLLDSVASAPSPLAAWRAALDELLELAWLKVEDEISAVLPSVPRLDTAGFNVKEKLALARQLEPTPWLDLALLDLKDLPIFEYCVRQDDFIPFQDASPGQQATALLSILLLQDGPPLVIDQPEDDLNMKVISEVVETLWRSKGHRQLIFASHNANLVVNGDAELVISCDYRTSSTESGGKIKLTGAIDDPTIRSEITEVMEGGEDAFKLRQLKYGF